MYSNLSIVYDKLMDVDYASYFNIIDQELKDKKNLLILDLGCGSGNIIPKLSNYGKVFATDVSENMLIIARQKNPQATYFCLDILNTTTLNKEFDFIISAFDVLNYLENFNDFKCGLKEVYKSLKKGGKFIFDIHTPQKINYMLENQPFIYESEEISYLWFTYPTKNELEVESELTFFVKEKGDLYKKLYEFQKQRTYNIELVKNTLEEIGFKIKKYFCDFNQNNLDYNNSDRIIFILEK